MNYYERSDNCLYNPIHVRFNEDLSIGSTFSSSLQYPSFFTLRNSYFNVSQNVLNNINSTIKSDVFTFKNGLTEEEGIQFRQDSAISSNLTFDIGIWPIPNPEDQIKYQELKNKGIIDEYGIPQEKEHVTVFPLSNSELNKND